MEFDVQPAACHKKNINVCMDFVMNHISEDHEWAKRPCQGDCEYVNRYFFYKDDTISKMYEKTAPQVFPTTDPGNFTWLPDAGHYVMTSFYPYQCDLNYKNPRVFNEMMYNFLHLSNHGIDIVRIDAVPYIWKELNTQCQNLKQVHTIIRLMRIISEIVCLSVLLGEVVMELGKVVPYFETVEKPECHMLYNVTTMAATWHTVATWDVRLKKSNKAGCDALCLFMQSGIPVLYSGNEIGQVNDYTYKDNPSKADDSHYIHRGTFLWHLVDQVDDKISVAERIFNQLGRLENIRKSEKVFVCQADTWTVDTFDSSALCIGKVGDGFTVGETRSQQRPSALEGYSGR